MSIRLKSYFSGTVEAAMALARKELGEDAMLIHSRPAQPEVRHLGVYEVVFGVYPGAEEAAEPLSEPLNGDPQGGASVAEPAGQQDSLAQQVAVLRQEMERMMQALSHQTSLNSTRAPNSSHAPALPQAPVSTADSPEALANSGEEQPVQASSSPREPAQDVIYRLLVEQELDATLARETAQGRPLEDAFEVNAMLGREGAARVIVALVGPPGCGKTTTIAKLAARYGLQARKRVQLLSIDVLRIGASDQLRTLASLLGIGFGFAETPLELDRMIEEHYKKDLILIDTPGLSKADLEDARELAQMIGSDPDIDTHLVLPASMKHADLTLQIEQFRGFHPRKLIFTRMDETSRYGALLSLAASTGLPVSFLAQGQRIPDDLEPATKERLLELVGVPSVPQDSRAALGLGAAA